MQRNNSTDSKIPRHIAIIMDGNRRWAQSYHLPGFIGHRKGIHALTEAIHGALQYNVPFLTVFAFSTDNWNRSPQEVSYLLRLLSRTIYWFKIFVQKKQIRIHFIGNRKVLSESLQKQMKSLENFSAGHKSLHLTIAFNYGSRDELVRAIHRSLQKPGFLKSWEEVQQYLDTYDLPDVDLMIRTSGEQRLSDFLLLQSAYAEIIFLKKFWPSFTGLDFRDAIEEYQRRNRTFGK